MLLGGFVSTGGFAFQLEFVGTEEREGGVVDEVLSGTFGIVIVVEGELFGRIAFSLLSDVGVERFV